MSFLDGQEFTVPQPAGVKIVAFTVNQTPSEKWDSFPYYLLEKLECTQNEVDGRITKTFSIPTDEEVLNVIILSIAKNRCVIGHGKVKNNQFILENETIHLQYTNMADVGEEEKEFSFRYNSKRQIVIIDAETGEQVIPKITKNEVTNGFDGKYKLVPYKNYIALELAIKIKGSKTNVQKKNPFMDEEQIDKKTSMEEIANMKI